MNNHDESFLNEEDADRGLPSITRESSGLMNKVVPILLGLVALIAVNGGFDSAEDSSNNNLSTPNKEVRNLIGAAPLPPPPPKIVIPVMPEPIITTMVPPPPPSINNGEKVMTPEERKRLEGMFVKSISNGRVNTSHSGSQLTDLEAAQAQAKLALGDFGEAERADGLNAKLTPARLEGSRATLLIDRNMFVTKGSFLDCVLETAISSDLAGMTSCRLTRDVYSTSGKVLLIERGSKIVGEYQSGMQKGKARIFVLWSRIETPTGVIVKLDSAGTGALGRSGHSGFIDTHFWERFGSAILLSLIDDVGNFLSNQASGDNNISFGSTGDAAENSATIALKDSIGIPPTLIKHQGDHINIIVARDLDFRSVYALKTTH
ncbi:Inner membrane protein of type IV secretion of T-DNA complex, TonB-like, VirB10 [Bathymodiolus heckerae thiotrophic gill symbiont]|uniref:type IV secretion system protein VirB10 n=1 Tax=Bathymodiolus heckerae thiotrophic gill symbiont TaxID=1052212 RepID=UPI0010B75A5B|nr:type IV secretion system protein VirB10 [Bathymodiolus heckerae thiotrophic gill symbiont]SHN91362.1 Inner membrane protein of type IV secretion of T-DNA complex, TonB-like, VirB10 [Bathymodiolus heckerae thiotrophic gill symbiont]